MSLSKFSAPVMAKAHGANIPGSGKTQKTTEDMHVLVRTLEAWGIAVADGHGGLDGRKAAEFTTGLFNDWMIYHTHQFSMWTEAEWKIKMDDLFHYIHDAFRRQLQYDNKGSYIDANGVVRKATKTPYGWHEHALHGGTTFSCAVIFTNQQGQKILHTAHVGDSEIMLLTKNKLTGVVVHEILSEDHSPMSLAEYKRLLSFPDGLQLCYKQRVPGSRGVYHYPRIFKPVPPGTSIEQIDQAGDELYDEELKRAADNLRTANTHNLMPSTVSYDPSTYAKSPHFAQDPCEIGMTRAIGDYYGHPLGLSATPSQTHTVLDDEINDHVIVVASDGVWDTWLRVDFANFLMNHLTTHNFVETIDATTAETLRRTHANFGASNFDDISLVGLHI